MRRGLRISFRVGIGLVLAVALAVLLGLVGVDYGPYVRTAYFRSTSSRLDSQINPGLVTSGPLRAGFAKVKLTPGINAPADDPGNGQFQQMPLAGFGARNGAAATGIHDDLWVKAVALEVNGRKIVLVASDALIVPREVAEAASAQIERELSLPREALYFGATHSHSSIGGWGQGLVAQAFAGPFNPGVRTWFASRLVTAVRMALTNSGPASFACGSFSAPDFVRNRLVGDKGRIDPEFSVLWVRREDGLSAVVGAFAAHATVLGSGNFEVSADYPGEWCRAVESATGGLAVFFGGSVGSHSPSPGAPGFDGTRRMGGALAARTTNLLTTLTPRREIAFGTIALGVDLPELHARLTDERRLRPVISSHLLPVAPRTFIQALRMGEALWVSTPCDFSGELALPLKDHFALRGLKLTVTSFNGDYIGYVIPSKYYHMDGYEPRTMSFFGPTIPDYFDELVRRLGEAVAGAP